MDIHNKTQIKAALRQSFGAVVYAINDLNEQSFVTPWSEGKWSPSEIIGHLILSTKPVTRAMTTPKSKLEEIFGKNNREEHSFQGLKEKYLSRLSAGVKAPPMFTYSDATDEGKESLIGKFTSQLDQLLLQIDNWSEKDLSDYVLPHPAIGNLTIREMLFFTHYHTGHHLEQINQVVE